MSGRPFNQVALPGLGQDAAEQVCDTIMRWSSCVNPITNNSAHKRYIPKDHGALMAGDQLVEDGDRLSATWEKPQGLMVGAGYHASMEKGKIVVAYAPKPGNMSVKK